MSTKKRTLGTKAQLRAIKEKERQIATALFLASILIAITLSAHSSYLILYSSSWGRCSSRAHPTLIFNPPKYYL